MSRKKRKRGSAPGAVLPDEDALPGGEELLDDLGIDSLSLESILAEYKGLAYIEGDKKTPPDVLDEETKRIILEETGRTGKARPAEPARKRQTPPEPPPVTPPRPAKEAFSAEKPRAAKDTYSEPSGPAKASPAESSRAVSEPPAAGTARPAREAAFGFSSDSISPTLEDFFGPDAETPRTRAKTAVDETENSPFSAEKAAQREESPFATRPGRFTEEEFEAPSETVKISRPDSLADTGVIPFQPPAGRGETARPDTGRFETPPVRADKPAEEWEEKRRGGLFSRLRRGRTVTEVGEEEREEAGAPIGDGYGEDFEPYDEAYEEEYEDEEFETPVIDEEIFEEPDFKAATRRFANLCNAYSVKTFLSAIVSLVMVIVTFSFGGRETLSERDYVVATGVLLILLLVSMAIGIEQMIEGVTRLVRRKPGYETLNLFACLAAAGGAIYAIAAKNFSAGLPYCAAASMAVTAGLWGEKVHYRAFTETMKTATSASMPQGVVTEVAEEIGHIVTRKIPGRTGGFYNRLVSEDIAERVYRTASPILLVASVVLALYTGLSKGRYSDIPFYLAAILTAAAPLSASAAFAYPFSATARRLRKTGAAVAGWGGAEDLFTSDGVSVTDDDLFPTENIAISGVRVFDNVSPERAVRYTASMIAASGSGLAPLFTRLASRQGSTLMKVDDFTCYEGGIGGTIRGDRVFTGNAAFMKLMGIKIHPSLNLKNAAFTAINRRLVAVFILEYTPVKTVQRALVTFLRHKIRMFFAVRDFGIMPVMLEQKYRISVDDVEYLPIRSSYELSDDERVQSGRVAALLSREGLLPFAEAVTGAKRLRNTAVAATAFSIFSAVCGLVIMFIVSWFGGAASGPVNLVLYRLAMLIAFLLIGGFARYSG